MLKSSSNDLVEAGRRCTASSSSSTSPLRSRRPPRRRSLSRSRASILSRSHSRARPTTRSPPPAFPPLPPLVTILRYHNQSGTKMHKFRTNQRRKKLLLLFNSVKILPPPSVPVQPNIAKIIMANFFGLKHYNHSLSIFFYKEDSRQKSQLRKIPGMLIRIPHTDTL